MLDDTNFLMINSAYLAYLTLSILMTIWVAKVLSESGKVFLIKCFGQDEELAESTNRLLVIGFYLVNVGFICTRLDTGWNGRGGDLIPYVTSKVGLSILVLGAMHFFNMVMIAKFGRTVNGWLADAQDTAAANADAFAVANVIANAVATRPAAGVATASTLNSASSFPTQ